MTLAQLILKTIVAIALLSLWKVVFFGYANAENLVVTIIYFIVAALISIAVVRRFGPLNYLETFLVMAVWLVVAFIVDFIFVAQLVSTEMYGGWRYWVTHLVMLLAIIVFDKKLHVEARKALRG